MQKNYRRDILVQLTSVEKVIMAKSKLLYFIKLFFLLIPAISMAQHVELLQQNIPVSIRGVSVVDNNVAWISSSKGYFAITKNGGKSWIWRQVKGFEKSDFRDIEAFSATEAVIMSSGAPALILKTHDGGDSWKVCYRKDDSTYFLDAMDFDNFGHGFVMGDPLNNKFLLLETNDGGYNWNIANGPNAVKGQAAFAASGTCLKINNSPAIVTGGTLAEIINKDGSGWVRHPLPILQGQTTQGAFSLAVDRKHIVVVGGDYKDNKRQNFTSCYSADGGLTWHLSNSFPSGYQSCVEIIGENMLISTGTSGTNISKDGGKNWLQINNQSFNVCSKAKHGNLVILAGDYGKIGVLKK